MGSCINRLYIRIRKEKTSCINNINQILTGDLNVIHQDIDIYDPVGTYNKAAGNCEGEKLNFTKLLSNGYVDVFRALNPDFQKFSYFSLRFDSRARNRGWRLDYFVASKKILDKIDNCYIRNEITGSDHTPIVLTLFKGDKKRDKPIEIPELPTSPVPQGYKQKKVKNVEEIIDVEEETSSSTKRKGTVQKTTRKTRKTK